jgi:catechol 2,3-dioxygenase-like lactoylglutathione lyase family enzyme
MFLGLRTVIYPVGDLDAAKRWWSRILGVDPYFDQPFYVGFNVNGYELALDPNGHTESGRGPVVYWGVKDIAQAVDALSRAEAAIHAPVTDHGGGIRTATLTAPDGSLIGVIENPHFPGPASTSS